LKTVSKTFDIKLDVERNLYSPMQILFYVANNDVDSVELDFEIIQDDQPYDLTGKTLQMAIKKPSGAVIYEGIEITSAPEGKANTTLHQTAYIESGLHTAEIYIQDAGETLVISPFYYNSWESISIQDTVVTDPTTGDVYWQNILNKPLTFPPSVHSHAIGDVTGLQNVLDSKANIGETGGTTTPIGIADVTGLQGELDAKMDDGDAYLKTETYNRSEIDSMALGGGGTDVIVEDNLLSTSTTNALSSNQGRILDESKADVDHDHAIADVTGLQPALDGKVDDAEMINKADVDHVHEIADVTGLQVALDGKMDDGDAYLKTQTYSKGEVYNRTEIDQMTMGTGGGSPVIVEDNLMSTSTTNALSSNQGRILDETKSDIDHVHTQYALVDHIHDLGDVTGLVEALDGKADDSDLATKSDVGHVHTTADITDFATGVAGAIPTEYLTDAEADALFLTPTEGDARYQATGTVPAHVHTSADITDFGTAVAGAIPTEYLTETEGDGRYQAIGTVPAHTHDEYLTQPEGDALYQPLGTIPANDYLTSTEADALFLTPTEGDGRYQAINTVPAHTHTSANITDFATAVAGAIPTEYLTATEGDAVYQPKGVVPAHTHTQADITFGGINAQTYVDNGDNYILNTRMAGLTLWKGTQAQYDALTPVATTLYFITG